MDLLVLFDVKCSDFDVLVVLSQIQSEDGFMIWVFGSILAHLILAHFLNQMFILLLQF
jgi:hypothetical protein